MHRCTGSIAVLVGASLFLALPALADKPKMRAPSELTVCLQPLGPHDKRLLAPAAAGIRYVFGFEVRTLDKVDLPRAAYYPPRKRYRAEKLLDFLDEKVVPDSGCDWVVGFTKVDISTTKDDKKDWGILGLGTIGGPSAVVSSFRMRRKVTRRVLEQRTVKVVNHELGHALGLEHYNKAGCVMHDALGTVKTVDTEDGVLCERSRDRISTRHRVALPVRDAMDWEAVLGK